MKGEEVRSLFYVEETDLAGVGYSFGVSSKCLLTYLP